MIHITPSSQFQKLPQSKQDMILEACLLEFAEYGYDLASTNRIATACGISKGALFKYFGDKEGLFLWICEENIRLYTENMQIGTYRDVFECILDFTNQKLRWLRERPIYYQLSMRVFKEPEHPVYAKVKPFSAPVREKQLQVIHSLLPIQGLRAGVTDEQVLSMLFWVAQGLQDQYASLYPLSAEPAFDDFYRKIMEELTHYFDLIRYAIFETNPLANQ